MMVNMGSLKFLTWFGVIENLEFYILLDTANIACCIRAVSSMYKKIMQVSSAPVPFFVMDVSDRELSERSSILCHKVSILGVENRGRFEYQNS